jgi:alpha-L-rhamnosidase
MKKYSTVVVTALVFFCCSSFAQTINDSLLQNPWKAQWITAPGNTPANAWIVSYDASFKEYGVYKFRKSFSLAAKPSSFVVHVSADNRYKLYVNEYRGRVGLERWQTKARSPGKLCNRIYFTGQFLRRRSAEYQR